MGFAHGFNWTDEIVKEYILKVKNTLMLNRMPTRKEIEAVMHNSSLTSKISRTKGYYGWAKELNLPIKESETTLGKKYEFIIKELLEQKDYIVEKMIQNYNYDLLINNNVKIDIKVGKPYIDSNQNRWHTFNLYKKYSSCDIYIIICLDENDKIEKLLIIPSSKCKVTQLSLGKESKYDIYKNNYDLINKYIKFYETLNQ